MVKTMGYEMPEKYSLDPASQEFQQMMAARQNQQQPNQLAEAEQVKGQFALQAKQMEVQFKAEMEQAKRDYEAQLEMIKNQLDAEQQEADRRSKEAIEVAKLEIKAMIEGLKIDIGKRGIGAGLQNEPSI